ncbi:hypothetical protein [Phormidium tenue]|nr:hypothetical protein [Phormidium tenue]
MSRRAAMFEYLSPRSLATPQEVIEYLELQQAAQDFRLEVEHRVKLEAYYQWYDQVAAENRRDLEQMRSEANLLTWFSRRPV